MVLLYHVMHKQSRLFAFYVAKDSSGAMISDPGSIYDMHRVTSLNFHDPTTPELRVGLSCLNVSNHHLSTTSLVASPTFPRTSS